jgi:hypothetical protein
MSGFFRDIGPASEILLVVPIGYVVSAFVFVVVSSVAPSSAESIRPFLASPWGIVSMCVFGMALMFALSAIIPERKR